MINTIFTDIGGVLLTNGWDRNARKRAVINFHLDKEEFDSFHKQYYNQHEQGKLSLDQYLDKVIFFKKRDFSKEEFISFMKSQSEKLPDMIEMYQELKTKHHFRIVAVSNEGRELAEYRIKTFNLTSFIDTFIFSSFVGFQKPDPRIFQAALDITQVPIDNLIYIDDREELADAAKKFGFQTIHHTSYASSKKNFLDLRGL